MCIKDKKMTNSQILQFIVEELQKTTISWKGQKELFEIICAPLSYGNDTYQERKKAKNKILTIFKDHETFDKKQFSKLADNILCGENQQKYTIMLLTFLEEELKRLDIPKPDTLPKMLEEIPCRTTEENNYKNSFNYWLNGHTDRINRQEVKQRLEQNFYFSPSLWNQGEYMIKQTIREGVAKFVKNRTQTIDEIHNIFEEIKKEFNMKNQFTNEEKEQLLNIQNNMLHEEIKSYLDNHTPLQKYHSQEFIFKLIPLLYRKGYHTLWLNNVIEALDLHIKGHKQIKKILAHLYGTPEIAEYEKAFQLLESIQTDNDKELIDLRTEAISNLRRHKLSDKHLSIEKKKEISQSIINYYDKVFKAKEEYHYYPAINLAYMLTLESFFDEEDHEQNLIQQISDIYKKCEPSIKEEQQSDDPKLCFYANITHLEFMLLKGQQMAVLELERYLEIEDSCIPLPELARTQRQMQFFLDHIETLPYLPKSKIINNIQSAVIAIDDFIELQKITSIQKDF